MYVGDRDSGNKVHIKGMWSINPRGHDVINTRYNMVQYNSLFDLGLKYT